MTIGLQEFSAETVYVSPIVTSVEGIFTEVLVAGALAYAIDVDLTFRWYPDSLDVPALNSVILPYGQSLSTPGRWKLVVYGGSQGPQGPQGYPDPRYAEPGPGATSAHLGDPWPRTGQPPAPRASG